MIPVKENIINQSGGILRTADFTAKVENLGVLFHILRNQLYSDPIMAVIREYSTNACDAHNMSNQREKPVQVTLPTTLDCFLKIRDFGTGLTDEQIFDIYASYGESTKRQTQDATGMLGIGCKSGFAYNDSFIVNSYKDGKITSWNAFIDPSNKGQMAKMAEADTTEPSGIEIVIPVKDKDMDKFHEKAAFLFKFFKVLPDIRNLSQGRVEMIKEYRDRNPIYTGADWKYFGDQKTSYAIMGNIPYPIDKLVFSADELTDDIKGILDGGIHIEFPIGEVEFAASREALQYTNFTKKAVLDKLQAIGKALIKQVGKSFGSCKSLWEAKCMYSEVFELQGGLHHLRHLFASQVVFKGKKVTSNEITISQGGVYCSCYSKSGKMDYNINGKRVQGTQTNYIHASKKALVVVNDNGLTNGIMNRIVPLIEDKKYDKVYLINYNDAKTEQDFIDKTSFDAPTVKLSTLPKEKLSKYYPNLSANGGVVNPKHVSQGFELDMTFKPSYSASRSDYWKVSAVNPETDAGVYVAINQFEYKNQGGWHQAPSELLSILTAFKEAGFVIPTVYGFKEKSIDKVVKNPKMVSLWEWIKNELKNYLKTNPQLEQSYADYKHLNSLQSSHSEIENIVEVAARVDAKSPLAKFATDYKKFRGVTKGVVNQMTSLEKVAGICGHKLAGTPSVDLTGEIRKMTVRYPMMFLLASNVRYDFKDFKTQSADYVNLVDTVTP